MGGPAPNEEDYIQFLPPEIFRSYIFPCLDGVSLIRCRRVCTRWKDIIDEMLRANLWKNFCRNDYRDAFMNGAKTSPDMTWYHIYRNWTMWPRVASAEITFHTFPVPPTRIESVQVTDDGALVVLQRDAIRFYDIKTLKPCTRHREIAGTFINYQENYRAIVLWGVNNNLLITKRRVAMLSPARNMMIENVRRFFLDRRTVYYCVGRSIFRVNLCRPTMVSEELPPVSADLSVKVLDISMYGGRLYVRTSDLAVRLYVNSQFVDVVPPSPLDTSLDIYGKCFTVNSGDVLYSSEHRLRIHHKEGFRDIPQFPTVTAVQTYNNALILGTSCGRVLLYRLNDENSLIDFDPEDILWQQSFGEENPDEIISVTVAECRPGQCLIAATNQTVHLVMFEHFKRRGSPENDNSESEVKKKQRCI